MKKIIVQSQIMLKTDNLKKIIESMLKTYREDNVIFLPAGFTYEVVEVDDIAVCDEVEITIPERGCFGCVYENVLAKNFPCCDCHGFSNFKKKEKE